MFRIESLRTLVLAPHTDDAELGTGGLISRLSSQGTEVHSVAFSTAEESVPEGYPKNILEYEFKEASQVLDIPQSNLHVLKYPVRRFSEHRQDILEHMVQLRKEIQPDVVLVPSSTDVHQDHNVICVEAQRAFKATTILGYELPWNNIEFRAQAVIGITSRNLEMKIEAVRQYRSQQYRPYLDADALRGWARMRGITIGIEFAEAYEVIRWVVR